MLLTIWITDSRRAGLLSNEGIGDYSYGDDDYYRENEADFIIMIPDTQDSKFEEKDIDILIAKRF